MKKGRDQVASLNFLQRNLLVRGIRAGKTFEEAAKGLPVDVQKHPDLAKNWKAWAEAEAKKDDASEPKVVRLDPDEFLRLKKENESLRKANAEGSEDLMEAQATIEKLNASLAEAHAEIEKLTNPKKK